MIIFSINSLSTPLEQHNKDGTVYADIDSSSGSQKEEPGQKSIKPGDAITEGIIMSTEYKFLILEDVETNTELIMDQVRTADIICKFEVTDNEEGFKRLIDDFKPDLILSDYSLPTYDGMSALKHVLKYTPDIPVILITGTTNEETAVRCMKAGAVDYILKDNMNRLGLAVIAALENKKVKIEKQKAWDEIRKLSTVVEQSPIAISILDLTGKVEYVNPSFSILSGYQPEDIIGKNMLIIDSGSLSKEEHAIILSDSAIGKIQQKTFRNVRKNGDEYYVSAYFAPYMNSTDKVVGLIEVQEDITQRLVDQKQIEDDLKEKELLLQEIYHRVNNNMQTMISLFNMQIERSELQAEKDVLAIAQSRVGAMSAIHNDIYQERSFTAINFKNVISHIFSTLCGSLTVFCGKIELHVEADVPDFGLDLAQPSALIVGELLSNCIRHAYPDGRGAIYVNLSEDESNEITLMVKDNGVGVPESIVPAATDTTGLNLVYMLAEGQLGGTVKVYKDNGTTVEIKFKRITDKKRF